MLVAYKQHISQAKKMLSMLAIF